MTLTGGFKAKSSLTLKQVKDTGLPLTERMVPQEQQYYKSKNYKHLQTQTTQKVCPLRKMLRQLNQLLLPAYLLTYFRGGPHLLTQVALQLNELLKLRYFRGGSDLANRR
jgi:hypothetical protein